MPTTTRKPGPHGIDLETPGGIAALLDFHRATFGDARMEATGDAPPAGAPAAPPAAAPTPQPPVTAAPAATTPPAAATPPSGDTLPDDPTALKAMIADLRKENGASRTNAKQQAADEARTELVQELGKALGLVKDGEDAPKPEELAQQLTASRDQSRQAAVELAVYRTAGQHGANPAALTDSRSFLAKVQGLDPTAEDFTTKVTDAAKAAVTENPTLKAAQAAARSSVDHTGGTGETARKTTSIEAAAQAAYQ